MKKTLFAALALVSMASCSNEEVLEVAQKEAIGFENAFVNNSTRSVVDPSFSSTTANKMFDKFQVYGFVEGAALFGEDGTEVTGSGLGESGNWTYTETQYWIEGGKYNFSAVAPKTGWSVKANTEPSKDKVSLTVTNTDGTNDVLFACTDEIVGQAAGGNDKVAFTFNHILSKVKFSFTNKYLATNTVIRVRDIKITDAYATGDVELTSTAETNANTVISNIATWSNQASKNVTLSFGNAATTGEFEDDNIAHSTTIESYNERLLIPGQATYNVTFIVDIVVNGSVVKTYTNHTATITYNFEAGKSYDILAEITEKNIDPTNEQEPIEFTVTAINGWDNPNGSTTEVKSTVNTSGN